jgi:hypothetical protein
MPQKKPSPNRSHRTQTAKALRIIRQNNPVTPAQWKALGLKFKSIGHGVFRETVRIVGTDLVIKAPIAEGRGPKFDYSEGIAHAKSEMNRLGRLARIDVLKPHLPVVYWYDAKNGQTVMKYYPPIPEKQKVELLGKVVKSLVAKLAGVAMSDIHEDNIRQKRSDWQVCVFTDLGY